MSDQPSANRVTLKDVLRLVLPLDTQLTSSADTGRLINWVAMLSETQKLDDQVLASDLAILPPGLQESAGEKGLLACIRGLGELPAAALITFRPVSKTVAQTAEDLDLPLLVVPEGATQRDIHQGVAALLIDRQKQVTERGMQLYRRLTELSREGHGLQAMTDVMSRLTGKIIVVQDKRLEIQAITLPADSSVAEVSVRKALGDSEMLPPLLRNRKAAARARQSHWQHLIRVDDQKMARLVSPIISGDRARGYLSLVGPPDALDPLDRLAAEHGAAACALEMAKVKAVSEAKKALRGNFLEGLLAGRLPENEIGRLAGRLDHDTDQPHAILTFTWDGADAPTLRRLETLVNWLLASNNRAALSHVYSDDHVCIFQALEDGDAAMSAARELGQQVRKHARAEFPKARLLSGLSGPAKSLAEWPETYRQAVQAMSLGKRLNLDRLVAFNSLGVYQLLAQLDNIPFLQRFCDEVIGPLDRYDRQHRSELVQTITAYFDHHGNISQTAESLFIHRNTLLYRLERIQELTGQDLNEADTRLAMHLALKLWQLRPDTKPKA